MLAILLLIVWLGMPQPVSAQWTTNGNNINNTNTGNVGIGTTTPGGKLQVAGDTYFGSMDGTIPYAVSIGASGNGYGGIGYGMKFSLTNNAHTYSANDFSSMLQFQTGGFRFRTAPLGTAGNAITFTDIMTGLNNGNIGIGTTTPGYRLHIAGNNTTAGGFPVIKIQNTQTGGHSYWLYSGALNNAADFGLYDETDNTYRMYVKGGSGNVGFGTYAPRGALDVAGGESYAIIGATGTYGSGAILSGSTGIAFLSNNVYLNAAANQFKVVDSTKISAGLSLAGRDVYFRSFTAAATPLHTELLFINGASGNVGIGTITPAYKLDLVGSLNTSGGLCIAGDCKTSWSQVGSTSQWTTTGSNTYYNTGNVAIGTTTATYRLDVQSSSNIIARFSSTAAINNQVLIDAPAGYNSNLTLQQSGASQWYLGNRADNNRFSLIEATGSVEVFSILQNGNVGIGTTIPTAKLDVNGNTNITGNITVSGNINAKYQDVAEWVPSSQKLSAGTVVVLDTEQSNHVLASSSAYDTRVAGVISEQPGISLGESGENKVLVATTGRVRIKVDATRTPIRIGDLLVTSDREGYAMKSEPVNVGGRQLHAPGTLLGKALEPLEKGMGEILVLLSLQ
jgi:hypothetical protein